MSQSKVFYVVYFDHYLYFMQSSAGKLYTTLDNTAVICDRNYCQVTYICPLYILRPPKF
jgi:hypothetical protein